jgi:hypothetical protein
MTALIIMLLKQLGVALISAILSTRVVLQWFLLVGKKLVKKTKTKTDDEFFAPVEKEIENKLKKEDE